MQASPDPGVVDFAHERVEVVVRPRGLNQLRNGGTAGCKSPGHLVGPEETPDRIRDRRRRKRMSGRIFGVIHRDQRRPCRIRISVRIAIGVRSRNRCPRPPGTVEVLGLETSDIGVGGSRVHHGEEARSVPDIEGAADHQIVQALVDIRRLPEEIGRASCRERV